MSWFRIAMFAGMLFLVGCAHSFTEKGLNSIDRSISFADIRKSPDAFIGRTVMVGGVVAAVHSTAEGTIVEVAQMDLTEDKVPNDIIPPGGQFLATSPDFAVTMGCSPGRLVTMIGEVKGKQIQKREKAEDVYPVIAIRELHLWNTLEPERFPLVPGNYDPYYWGYPTNQYQERPLGTRLKP